jgi:hypothetical protein
MLPEQSFRGGEDKLNRRAMGSTGFNVIDCAAALMPAGPRGLKIDRGAKGRVWVDGRRQRIA